jgi:hypothetical protein
MLNGSGLSLSPQPEQDPVTLLPATVPKLKLAPVTMVSEFTPATVKVNLAVPFRNGSCGPPVLAIELLA